MQVEEIHPRTIITIQTNHKSKPTWVFPVEGLTDEELNDMVVRIRNVIEASQ